MISQGIIVQDNTVLMVKDRVDSGAIVWNFPDGAIDEGETPEQACIREVKEETGYDIQLTKLLDAADGRHTYLAEIVGGELFLDTVNEPSISEIAWISWHDDEKFDAITEPIRKFMI